MPDRGALTKRCWLLGMHSTTAEFGLDQLLPGSIFATLQLQTVKLRSGLDTPARAVSGPLAQILRRRPAGGRRPSRDAGAVVGLGARYALYISVIVNLLYCRGYSIIDSITTMAIDLFFPTSTLTGLFLRRLLYRSECPSPSRYDSS